MAAQMAGMAGELREKPIYDVVRALYAAGGTGTLEVVFGDQKRRLYFDDGDLFLAASHPLAKHYGELAARLEANGEGAAVAREKCADLVERIANVVGEWRSGAFRFDGDPASLPEERVGPLPTERLVMFASTVGLEEPELVARLGGLDAQLAARADFREPDLLGLAPEEGFLLERLAQPMTVETLLAESPVSRLDSLRRLAQLKVTGRIRTLGKDGSGARTLAAASGAESALVERLHQRFERVLKEEPLKLPVDEFRRQISDLFTRLGGMNAYELLEAEPTSPVDHVQARYEEVALLVHPANEAAYGLQGLKPMLEMLFERATQAYLTLSDPERRRRYNESQAIELSSGAPSGEAREEERRELGREYYERGLTMAARGDFHFAVEMLELATKTDRKAEYLLALARIQAKNPHWASRAIGTCRSALEVDPHNADARFQLGELFEAAGDLPRARAQFNAAVRENPQHVQASARLRSLEGSGDSKPASGGLFDRLFGRRE